ncbi:hypothetical protein YW5DRAFT_03295 [Streptomyces sp. Ncost-T6T-1]|nr:hypothetical protein YW5DRAFT_03295 [Streptomyces sp. Ncost-T6T-1]
MSRSRHTALFALVTVAALTLTACAEPADPAGGGSGGAAARGKTPTTDVVSKVREDEAAAKLLPAGVREAGTLRIASSVGTPPGAFYEEDGSTPAGADIDFADAAARVLGLKLKREVASFEAILRRSAAGSTTWARGTSASPTNAAEPSTS